MMLEPRVAFAFAQRIFAVGIFVQSCEGLVTCRCYGSGEPWEWPAAGHAARRSGHPRPWFEGALGVGAVFLGRAVGSLWLLTPWATPGAPGTTVWFAILLLTSATLVMRTQGPLCGGSDSMFFQLQLGLGVASYGFQSAQPSLVRIGLAWIVAQSVLSYFLAGMSKARHVRWWNGAAVRHLLSSDRPYEVWSGARAAASRAWLCVWLGWAVVGFELLFPLVLILPGEARLVLLGCGAAFHFGNAAVLGLNRFFWAWVATYPALLVFGTGGA